jgi:hypothetical protein
LIARDKAQHSIPDDAGSEGNESNSLDRAQPALVAAPTTAGLTTTASAHQTACGRPTSSIPRATQTGERRDSPGKDAFGVARRGVGVLGRTSGADTICTARILTYALAAPTTAGLTTTASAHQTACGRPTSSIPRAYVSIREEVRARVSVVTHQERTRSALHVAA